MHALHYTFLKMSDRFFYLAVAICPWSWCSLGNLFSTVAQRAALSGDGVAVQELCQYDTVCNLQLLVDVQSMVHNFDKAGQQSNPWSTTLIKLDNSPIHVPQLWSSWTTVQSMLHNFDQAGQQSNPCSTTFLKLDNSLYSQKHWTRFSKQKRLASDRG